MSKKDPINQRMKELYEMRSRTKLLRRTPVIIRCDGKAFHTYCRKLDKPFDEGLIEDMESTTKFLCENIQGAKLGYCQSDEISILLTDYENFKTEAWFDYQVQKIVSVAASMATAKFNELRQQRTIAVGLEENNRLAFFDARCFNVPKEEVSNYFLSRQRDAVKNSVAMLAQSLFSQKELHGKNQEDMYEMCREKGSLWGDLHYSKKRGCTVMKLDTEMVKGDGQTFSRPKWQCIETPFTFNDAEFFKPLIYGE